MTRHARKRGFVGGMKETRGELIVSQLGSFEKQQVLYTRLPELSVNSGETKLICAFLLERTARVVGLQNTQTTAKKNKK